MACLDVSGLVAALLLSRSALGAPPIEQWYIGATKDSTHVEVWRGVGWEVGVEEPGWSVHGGYRPNQHCAVEGALLHAANLEWTEYFPTIGPGYFDATSRFDARAVQIAAVGIVPFGAIWEFHGKGGLAWSRLSGSRVLSSLFDQSVTEPFNEGGSGYLLGLGVGANVAERWSVRFEYQFFSVDRDTLGISNGDDATIDTFAVGVQYRFGGRSR